MPLLPQPNCQRSTSTAATSATSLAVARQRLISQSIQQTTRLPHVTRNRPLASSLSAPSPAWGNGKYIDTCRGCQSLLRESFDSPYRRRIRRWPGLITGAKTRSIYRLASRSERPGRGNAGSISTAAAASGSPRKAKFSAPAKSTNPGCGTFGPPWVSHLPRHIGSSRDQRFPGSDIQRAAVWAAKGQVRYHVLVDRDSAQHLSNG